MRSKMFLTVLMLFLFSVPACAETQKLRLLFTGDVMAHDQQLAACERTFDGKKSWDFRPQFKRVLPLFDDAFVIANLETVFAGKAAGYAGYPSFNTPDSLLDALKELGVNALTLANNHILDRGASGAKRTVEVLDKAKMPWTGLGVGDVPENHPLLLEQSGLRMALLSYSYGSNRALSSSSDVRLNTISDSSIAEGLKKAHAMSPDIVIVCFHWGNEYQYSPSSHQKAAADAAIKGGADMVIGTHPHVLQPIEVRSADKSPRLVAWSLGNFVSFQRTLPRERSCVLAVEIEKPAGAKRAVIKRVSAAPTGVRVHRSGGRRPVEVVYAGKGGAFRHNGLSEGELKSMRGVGDSVLGFLGADINSVDNLGFYTLWSSEKPKQLPKPTRKTPM